MIEPIPNPEFCKRLHRFDPDLQLNFTSEQGVWQIWHRNELTGELNFVMNVVNEDGSYRPLDDRTIQILMANRFFAENPKAAEKIFVDDMLEAIEKEQQFSHDEFKHFAKDPTLNRKFKEIQEKARGISWSEWQSVQDLSDGTKYVPHKTVVASEKPTV